MIQSLVKSRRAISPVVSAIFLFAIILGAIAASLGIIYPQIQSLNDEIELNTSGSTMLTLDNEIRTLILNGLDSKIFKTLDNGRTGYFYIDNDTITTLTLYNGINVADTFIINHPRLRIRQIVDQNPISQGTYRYLSGQSNQNTLYVNSTNSDDIPWPILNQSRPLSSDNVFTSLSYRYILNTDRKISEQQLQYNATIEIQMVNFTNLNDIGVGRSKPQIEIQYLGPSITSTPWYILNNDAQLLSSTLLSDPNSLNSIETPVTIEAPLEATTQFRVRIRFVFHQIGIFI